MNERRIPVSFFLFFLLSFLAKIWNALFSSLFGGFSRALRVAKCLRGIVIRASSTLRESEGEDEEERKRRRRERKQELVIEEALGWERKVVEASREFPFFHKRKV
ncbi:hypothetical protein CSUI_003436 [Cystoisospora suis]|uniref:Uncharacterized protein n=1 Tax=Cystoisospora suis TaxID=483139 RepID=A0A2C6KQF3_9APIC|nr:hypothetical protein CSUI_003436 [Cystoisospora suis]